MVSRITILSYGTRGDVQPLLVLAGALVAAGFEVTLGADTEFESGVVARGARFPPLRMDLRTFLASDRGHFGEPGGRPTTRSRRWYGRCSTIAGSRRVMPMR
ncbi:MAG: glycosyltransferase family 1 protein [SAR202 cluster bacterium]|jgi:hypothetical protein|nr:glycosyltransferase family 1 protein [SAR202 cluster bacterium]